MIKLICVDLDGTLLNNSGEVSKENKEAIVQALDQGIEVAIVSGRPNCFTTRILNQIDKRMGHVTFNGAYYRIAGKTKSFPVDFDVVKVAANIASKYDIRIYFKNKNLGIVSKDDPGIFDYDEYRDVTAPKDRIDLHYNVDTVKYFNEHHMDVLKIFSWDLNKEGRMKAGREIAKTPHANYIEYEDYFEVISDQTSKGKAILAMAEELQIKQEEIMCIGDNYNDLPMFEIAGLSVAMANACEDIRNQCDVVTLSNEDSGVAYAIKKYALKENEDEVSSN